MSNFWSLIDSLISATPTMTSVKIASDSTEFCGAGVIEYKDKHGDIKYDTYKNVYDARYPNTPEVFEIDNAIEVLKYFFDKYGASFKGQQIMFYCDHTSVNDNKKMVSFKEKLKSEYECEIEMSHRTKKNCYLMKYADDISRNKEVPEIGYYPLQPQGQTVVDNNENSGSFMKAIGVGLLCVGAAGVIGEIVNNFVNNNEEEERERQRRMRSVNSSASGSSGAGAIRAPNNKNNQF